IRNDRELASLKLVMLTAVTDGRWSAEAQRIGVDACLIKPVREQKLFACLRDLLEPPASDAASAPRRRPRLPSARGDARPRVLVAEDNPINAKVALRILDRLGYAAEAVPNGREAVEAAASGDYDAVLMDWQMPLMDGLEAAVEIRRREAPGRRMPIIAMTASATEGDRSACLASGMDDHIGKPVRPDELDRVLGR